MPQRNRHATSIQAPRIGYKKRKISEAFADLDDVVYIVRLLDGVKIGHSSNLRSRLYALQVKPDALLAVLPGGAAKEAELHERFAHLRSVGWAYGNEHFLLAGELLEFVNEHRTSLGLKPAA